MVLPLVGGLVWPGVPLGGALCEAQETWLVFFLWDCLWLSRLLRHTDDTFREAGWGAGAPQ